MILVDTSTWIDHARGRDTVLDRVLGSGRILLHPFVWGELLLNGLPREGAMASTLLELPLAPVASTTEAAAFIGWARLTGTGLGYVDAHLLVSAKLAPGGQIVTEDQKLRAQAQRLRLAYRE